MRTLHKDITVDEIHRFIAQIILMGHDDHHTIKKYWSTDEFCYTPFYSNVMKHDRFLHIMRYLHMENNEHLTDRISQDFNRLWKIRRVFNYLNNKYSTLYNPTEYLAVHEVTVKFKRRVGFQQYTPKKIK
jgi:hypothetical protein